MRRAIIVALMLGNASWCAVKKDGTEACYYASYKTCIQTCGDNPGQCLKCIANPKKSKKIKVA